jgi:hemin uptake protein HemP
MNKAEHATSDPGAAPTPVSSSSPRRIDMVSDRIDSRDLFIGTREVIIAHGSESYRLRLTAQNKLILTK